MTRQPTSPAFTPAASLLLAALAVVAMAGCGGGRVVKPADPSAVGGVGVDLPPEPSTPEGALRYLAWTVSRRDWRRYSEILTDDFRFSFASSDSAGNAYRDRALQRLDEVVIARNMFETGTPLLPPLTRVTMILATTPLVPVPDPRPGMDMRTHQAIRSNLVLLADNATSAFRIIGAGQFFLVRGDSAQIPAELLERGFVPDKTRWFVQRWEDETLESPGGLPSAAMPSRNVTWGSLKVLYR